MANEGATGGFVHAAPANSDKLPVVRSIFDFSAEALGDLRTWLEQNPPALPLAQMIGYQQQTQTSRVHRAANQSITTGASRTVITWDTKEFDYGGLWDGNTKLTVQLAGKYICGASVTWAVNTTGDRFVALRRNGVTEISSTVGPASTTGSFSTDQGTYAVLDLAVGDYLETVVAQNSGGNLNVTGDLRSNMWIVRVGT